MLHIRLTFIDIKTGWAPKLSAGPLKFLAPGEKMLSFVPVNTGDIDIWLSL